MQTHTASFTQQIFRLLVSVITLVATGAGIVVATTGAMFTDTTKTKMDVSTGWVDVTLGGDAMLLLSNLKPGDTVYRPMNFVNSGSLNFVYDITAVRPNGPNGALADVIQIETWETGDADHCNAAQHSDGTLLAESTSLTDLHVHDHVLAPGLAETLCFKITLPAGTSNSIAGKSASIDLNIATWQA
jgi:hypothetical protein